jgi:hypothetical protein
VEDRGCHRDLGTGSGDRFADVAGLDDGELLGVLLDERGQPAEQPGAIGGLDGASCGKCVPGTGDRLVGLVDAASSSSAIGCSVAGSTTVTGTCGLNHPPGVHQFVKVAGAGILLYGTRSARSRRGADASGG